MSPSFCVTKRHAFSVAFGIMIAATAGYAVPTQRPWMNPDLSPEARAALLEAEMTLDERIRIVHGVGAVWRDAPLPEGAIGSAGYVPGVTRLGIPALQETDGPLGVTNPYNIRPGDTATPLPSGLAIAATWDPEIADACGAMVGREARNKGFNVLLGGGVNLTRDPRNGRNFPYLGEDPLLAGLLAGEVVRGVQAEHVISTVKHFSDGQQETGKKDVDVRINEAANRESDLLAFELAIEKGQPGAVMYAYNSVNGVHTCRSNDLLNTTLKGDWGYRGWVMSDWGAVDGVDAAINGLDQESGEQWDGLVFFGESLQRAVQAGQVPESRLSDMVRRILRSMFAVGLFDHPPIRGGPISYDDDALVALRAAEEGIVLLTNRNAVLPIPRTARKLAIIGGNADAGVLSGGGSSRVNPVGGPARIIPLGGDGLFRLAAAMLFDPSSPQRAIQDKVPGAELRFNDGRYPKAAADLARTADYAIVFATQWMSEEQDAPDLSLPSGQEQLIEAVSKANLRTIVVLETGGPVIMPWLDLVAAVLEAWYPGARGGEAIANVLFGDINPSGRLPISFPMSETQLPRPNIVGTDPSADTPIAVDYNEGASVGYRGYASTPQEPLFPVGFGLSYTNFRYSRLEVTGGDTLTIRFDVENAGTLTGVDVPQVYLTNADGVQKIRLIGWARPSLNPGQTHRVTVTADPRLLADFDTTAHAWRLGPGTYEVAVSNSSATPTLRATGNLVGQMIKP